MHRTTRTTYLIAILLPVILFTCNVFKGQSSTSGAIRGIVSDPQGAVLPGSIITVTSQATAAKRTAIADGNGGYVVGLLPPGIYTVTFEVDGFKTLVPPPVTVIVNGLSNARYGPPACAMRSKFASTHRLLIATLKIR